MDDEGAADSAGAVSTHAPEEPAAEAPIAAPRRYSREDFRLRLDKPLFKRDEKNTADAPLLKEISWDSLAADADADAAAPVAAPPAAAPVAKAAPTPVAKPAPDPIPPAQAQSHLPQPPVADEVAPVVTLARAAEPVVEEAAPAPEPVVEPQPVVVLHTGSVPITDVRVAAELNRLAFVPDDLLEESTELPAIALSEPDRAPTVQVPIAARSSVPQLSTAATFNPRVAGATQPKPSRLIEDLKAASMPPVVRKKKRNGGRRFLSALIFLGLIGAGLYAAKRYVLDVAEWQKDVKPFAESVADLSHLDFDHPVTVEELPLAEYAPKLATSMLGLSDANLTVNAAEWRSLGLLTGQLDAATIGMAAMPDMPAFYDATSHTVFVAAGLQKDLHQFALDRALALALLDQHYGWSKSGATVSPAVALGARALADAAAIDIAARSLTGTGQHDAVRAAMYALWVDNKIAPSPSPWASAVIGRAGLPLRAYFGELDATSMETVLKTTLASDAGVYDAGRALAGSPGATISTPAAMRGLIYWYSVLSARIDSTAAWSAAIAWAGDEVIVKTGGTGQCVSAKVYATDVAAGALMKNAFDEWAALGPPGAHTTVSQIDPLQINIDACDPGATVATTAGSGAIPLGGAAAEHGVLAAALQNSTGLSDAALRCFVTLARTSGTQLQNPGDVPPMVDPDTPWVAAYVTQHPVTAEEIAGCRAVG